MIPTRYSARREVHSIASLTIDGEGYRIVELTGAFLGQWYRTNAGSDIGKAIGDLMYCQEQAPWQKRLRM
jgi:hypothetical protein